MFFGCRNGFIIHLIATGTFYSRSTSFTTSWFLQYLLILFFKFMAERIYGFGFRCVTFFTFKRFLTLCFTSRRYRSHFFPVMLCCRNDFSVFLSTTRNGTRTLPRTLFRTGCFFYYCPLAPDMLMRLTGLLTLALCQRGGQQREYHYHRHEQRQQSAFCCFHVHSFLSHFHGAFVRRLDGPLVRPGILLLQKDSSTL